MFSFNTIVYKEIKREGGAMLNPFFKPRGTVFDRPADMYVVNNTDVDFTLHKTQVYSGKLDAQPPQTIMPDHKGYFKGMNSGTTGSSGLITYMTKINDIVGFVSFFWTHPEGHSASFYYGYSSPIGLFYVTPRNNYDGSQEPTITNQNVYDFSQGKSVGYNAPTLYPGGHSNSVSFIVQYSLGHTAT